MKPLSATSTLQWTIARENYHVPTTSPRPQTLVALLPALLFAAHHLHAAAPAVTASRPLPFPQSPGSSPGRRRKCPSHHPCIPTHREGRSFHQASAVLHVASPTTFLSPLLLRTWDVAFPVPLMCFIILTSSNRICFETGWLQRPCREHSAFPTLPGLPFPLLPYPLVRVSTHLNLMS